MVAGSSSFSSTSSVSRMFIFSVRGTLTSDRGGECHWLEFFLHRKCCLLPCLQRVQSNRAEMLVYIIKYHSYVTLKHKTNLPPLQLEFSNLYFKSINNFERILKIFSLRFSVVWCYCSMVDAYLRLIIFTVMALSEVWSQGWIIKLFLKTFQIPLYLSK